MEMPLFSSVSPSMGGRKSIGAEKQPFEGLRWNGNLPSWSGENWVATGRWPLRRSWAWFFRA